VKIDSNGHHMLQDLLQHLQSEFPEIDAVNICETLEACEGDMAKCTEILRSILEEEAAEMAASSPSPLHALLDAVTALATLPVAEQPTESRSSLLTACAALEVSGIHLLAPVMRILDGVRDEATLTAGLDGGDSHVVRTLLHLLAAGTLTEDGQLPSADKVALADEFGTSDERRALEESLASAVDDLGRKGEALGLLQQAVSQQRQRALQRVGDAAGGTGGRVVAAQ